MALGVHLGRAAEFRDVKKRVIVVDQSSEIQPWWTRERIGDEHTDSVYAGWIGAGDPGVVDPKII